MSNYISGLWSAAPTPLTTNGDIDTQSLRRMLELHVQYRTEGIFLGGTCGEGAWLNNENKTTLLRTASTIVKGRLKIAFQASDNSPQRVAQNIKLASDNGADIAIISHPPQFLYSTPDAIRDFYLSAFEASTLPVGYYDLGSIRPNSADITHLEELALHPKVVLVKDSSSNPQRRDRLLQAKARKPELKLYCGDEFNSCDYIAKGYDGIMLGGLALHGVLSGQMLQAAQAGRSQEALDIQDALGYFLKRIYGPQLASWLNGMKYSLTQLGIFATATTVSGFPAIPESHKAIESLLRPIDSPLQLSSVVLSATA